MLQPPLNTGNFVDKVLNLNFHKKKKTKRIKTVFVITSAQADINENFRSKFILGCGKSSLLNKTYLNFTHAKKLFIIFNYSFNYEWSLRHTPWVSIGWTSITIDFHLLPAGINLKKWRHTEKNLCRWCRSSKTNFRKLTSSGLPIIYKKKNRAQGFQKNYHTFLVLQRITFSLEVKLGIESMYLVYILACVIDLYINF